jgi:tetratricopeptide (TPR) repeat protein
MVVGYACSWLTWICAELGYLHEGVDYAGKAERISRNFPKDHFLYFNSISGLGYLSFWMGNVKRVFEVGNALIEYSKNCSDIRSHARGYWNLGLAYYLDDDIASAIDCSEQSIKISKDPYYILLPKLLLGSLYIYDGKHQKAVNVLNEVVDTSEELGVQAFVTFAKSYLGVALIANGHLEPGLKMINAALKLHLQNNRKTVYAHFEHVLGKVYLQMIERATPVTLATVAKNVVQNFPDLELQTDESEYHFNKAVSAAKEIGANGILSLVYYDLGILNKSKQRFDLAKDYLLKAIKLFEKCETENYLQEAKKVLDTLR